MCNPTFFYIYPSFVAWLYWIKKRLTYYMFRNKTVPGEDTTTPRSLVPPTDIRHVATWCQTLALIIQSLIARFMGPTWGPSGADRTQVGPMLAPWTLLSEVVWHMKIFKYHIVTTIGLMTAANSIATPSGRRRIDDKTCIYYHSKKQHEPVEFLHGNSLILRALSRWFYHPVYPNVGTGKYLAASRAWAINSIPR